MLFEVQMSISHSKFKKSAVLTNQCVESTESTDGSPHIDQCRTLKSCGTRWVILHFTQAISPFRSTGRIRTPKHDWCIGPIGPFGSSE